MYAASTAVRLSFLNTLAERRRHHEVRLRRGRDSRRSSRRQVTGADLDLLIPPIDSRMPVIQFVRRTSPSVKTSHPRRRAARSMFSAAARSSTARNPALVQLAPLVPGAGGKQPGLPQQAADVLSVIVRRHGPLLMSGICSFAETISVSMARAATGCFTGCFTGWGAASPGSDHLVRPVQRPGHPDARMVQGDLDLFEQVPPQLDDLGGRDPGRPEILGDEAAELLRRDVR